MAGPDVRIALVGATGTIGSQIAELIGERNYPYSELKLFAQESSGRMVECGERSLPVIRFSGVEDLSAFDLAFLAVPAQAAAEIIEAEPGPWLIDLSAASVSPRDRVAIVAPGLTGRDRISGAGRGRVFGVPHPAAQVIATILQALRSQSLAAASIMLSASAAGHSGVSELFQQSADLLNARLELEDEPQVSFNIFAPQRAHELAAAFAAQIGVLGADSSRLVLNILRVPAFHGTGLTVFLKADPMQGEWPERLRSAPGLILVPDQDTAGLVDAVGQDGAVTRLTLQAGGAAIWCAFDAARLAALSAIWIAETLTAATASV